MCTHDAGPEQSLFLFFLVALRVKYHCSMKWTILFCFSALAKLLNSRKQNLSDISRREMLRKVKSAISVSAKRFSGYGQHVSLTFVFMIIPRFRFFRLILIKNIIGSVIFKHRFRLAQFFL